MKVDFPIVYIIKQESASKDINDAEEFVESLLSRLEKLAIDENSIDNLEVNVTFLGKIDNVMFFNSSF